MIFAEPPHPLSPLRQAICAAYLQDETESVARLLDEARLPADVTERITRQARHLVEVVREKGVGRGSIEAFLQEYDLSSEEGIVLMCLAEALLRIPDDETADRLIQDKIAKGKWDRHLGHSPSVFVNASTWGLMLTGKIIRLDLNQVRDFGSFIGKITARTGEPVIRLAMRQAMRILGHQFVMGETIEAALKRSLSHSQRRYRYSFDMLGEAALTEADAERFFTAYEAAIHAIGHHSSDHDLYKRPGISIKLSALHPRFDPLQRPYAVRELVPKVLALTKMAQKHHICVTIDAEECDRLDMTLEIFTQVLTHSRFQDWPGLGLAVQAYQKRAFYVLDWLVYLARKYRRRIPVRLVKGAYWDTEIKRAQELGLSGYPVFTRKAATDVSYLACVRKILHASDAIYPQFATHNAHTVAAILELAGQHHEFEFQRLHGMGETLYDEVLDRHEHVACRVYAPVGGYQELLPYLVRRLLENGANTSFVNRISDPAVPIAEIIADPVARLENVASKPHPRIPLPADIYQPERRNTLGINLADDAVTLELDRALSRFEHHRWLAQPLIDGEPCEGRARSCHSPADHHDMVGTVHDADAPTLARAFRLAGGFQPRWDSTPANTRADLLDHTADLLEEHREELLVLLIREGGKTVPDAISEVREACDFCRYYAQQARREFSAARTLPSITGEHNQLSLHGRGVFLCISPWNFPLAIFTGQIAAALAAGNTVIAKPASATPLIAARAVTLFHQAGIPGAALHFVPAPAALIAEAVASEPALAGIAFTGATDTAAALQRQLAQRPGALLPLIAETGGQNAMIADSSALPDQLVVDALRSAFTGAGQRCSALRVLFLQKEIADRVIELLTGAAAELTLGDPKRLATDIGPVINSEAVQRLTEHIAYLDTCARRWFQLPLDPAHDKGYFFPPAIYELDRLDLLKQEIFGPILHIIRFESGELGGVIDAINRTGYGLTCGLHSRIDATVDDVVARLRVGNVYVNRNIIGAVVGSQPFGGEGLSGTGPKAGGPHYLQRFATERTLTVNTSALGGNTRLLELDDR